MLTSVEIHPYYGDEYYGVPDDPIVLPLGGGGSYYVKNIDGLGPTKAEIVTTTYAGTPGGAFQTANVAARNPVMQVAVNPDYSVDDPFGELRRALYPYLNTSERVELRFFSDNMETVKAVAYLESFEPSIFSADPVQTLSFICPDPYFYSLEEIRADVTIPPGLPGLLTINNPGNARRTGFTFFIDKVNAPGINTMKIDGVIYPYPRYMDNKSTLSVGTYVAGEQMIFRIVTIPGKKSAGWMMSDTYHSFVEIPILDGGEPWEEYAADLLGYIDGWAYVVPGVNKFNISAPTSFPGPVVGWMLLTPRYVGL